MQQFRIVTSSLELMCVNQELEAEEYVVHDWEIMSTPTGYVLALELDYPEEDKEENVL